MMSPRANPDEKAGNGQRWPGSVPAQPLTLVLLVSFAAHPGMEGEAVGLGDALQSGIRSVQRTDGPTMCSSIACVSRSAYAVGSWAMIVGFVVQPTS